jgi:two-component system invasion response regulator UvrY
MNVFNELAPEDLLGKVVSDSLSRRELQVFGYIGVGTPPAVIAEALGLSVKSVSTYRARILEKLGVRSNAEIAVLSWRARKFIS